MQIFELHFNPKLKESQTFDSFIYEPENIYEKKLGGLYLVGEMKNAFPGSKLFLNNLASFIKKNFYILSAKSSEKALSQALKKTNDFLAEEIKKNNVNWLGNLTFAGLAINGYKLTFSKTGDLKIILIRNGQINDIGENPNLKELDPYPLKIFFNVISGKLSPRDIILVATKEIFDFFSEKKILEKIAEKGEKETIDEKSFKEIFPPRFLEKENNLDASGLCLIINIKEIKKPIPNNITYSFKEKVSSLKKISFQKKEISFFKKFLINLKFIPFFAKKIKKKSLRIKKDLFLSFLGRKKEKTIRKIKENIKIKKITAPLKIKIPVKILRGIENKKDEVYPKLNGNKKLIKRIDLVPKGGKKENNLKKDWKKAVLLIAALIFLLFSGFLIFKKSNSNRIKNQEIIFLQKADKELKIAENYLKENKREKANKTLISLWKEISLAEKNKAFLNKAKISLLKKNIEKELNEINHLEFVKSLQIEKTKKEKDISTT